MKNVVEITRTRIKYIPIILDIFYPGKIKKKNLVKITRTRIKHIPLIPDIFYPGKSD